MANVFILQAFIIGVPLVLLVSGDPVASYFVRTILVFVVRVSILGLSFRAQELSTEETK